MDSWKDGDRVLHELANFLSLKGYLTSLRVDRHEISFRVEDNPEHKTADDVARIINERLPSIKNNLSRRLGVTIISAGVGDKTKIVSSNGIEREEMFDGWNITLVLAVAGAAAIFVIQALQSSNQPLASTDQTFKAVLG